MKYYSIRILAALIFLGSFEAGFIMGAEYGKWLGWLTFLSLAMIGYALHVVADKIQKNS